VQFLSHPAGLYMSWNFGIQRLQSEYTYIATVCDTITRAGIEHLLAVAQAHQSDVVLSKPNLHTLDGRPAEIEWPIDDMIRTLGIGSPRTLHRLEAVILATVHAGAAFTGSCASDIFRTACLKRYPFPIDLGTAADGVWSTLHAAEASWTVTPEQFSRFAIHRTHATVEDQLQDQKRKRSDRLLSEAVQDWLRRRIVMAADLDRIGWRKGLRIQQAFLDSKIPFDRCRKGKFPWILNPRAWLMRARRQQAQARLHAWKLQAVGAFHESVKPGSTQAQ
jgi:hypothetical protein